MVIVLVDLLKINGCFVMVYWFDCFFDILYVMENVNIVLKKVWFVYLKLGKEVNVLLIEGIK